MMTSEIRKRIKILGWKNEIPIIYIKEAEQPSIDTTNLMLNYLIDLVKEKPFYLIADLSFASPPRAEVRALLRQRFQKINSLLLAAYVYVGNKSILKIAAKFLFAALGKNKLHIIKDIQHGLNIINDEG